MWKRRRPKQYQSANWVKIILIVLCICTVLVTLFFLKGKLFIVKQVSVTTNKIGCTSSDQIKSASALLGQSFFALDEKKITNILLEKFICVKDVNLITTFPNKVKVKVSGREPAAILVTLKSKSASASSFIEDIATPSAEDMPDAFLIDSQGVIFSKDGGDLSSPMVYMYDLSLSLGKKLNSEFIQNVLKILDKAKTFGVSNKQSWVSDDIFLINSDVPPLKIVFRLDDRTDIQIASLQLILAEAKIYSKQVEFIDLRFDKPIIRFAPKK